MRVLGLMSGTSCDGVDAAVVDFTYRDGHLTGRLQWANETPISPEGRALIQSLFPPARVSLEDVVRADVYLGELFAEVAEAALAASGGADAICSHGQTVCHWVPDGSARGTMQLGQPAEIAERTGLPVVADLRVRDLAAGGQGAPLVSFLDAALLAPATGSGRGAAALNLGGIANVTVRVGTRVEAWDTGPANALIDTYVTHLKLNSVGFDVDGRLAAAGTPFVPLLDLLADDPYYRLPAPKSTGKEHFNWEYLQGPLARWPHLAPVDVVATLTELTALTVARDLSAVGSVFVSGGGAQNPVLLAALRRRLPEATVELTDRLGVDAGAKEAILCALIGWCTLHGVPATLPGVTGARGPRVLGTITPGAGPLELPTPLPPLLSLNLEGTVAP
ncbi:anhydro-N-acetylmuramic acid kinase [Actinomyces sp. F1_1611]